MNVSSVAVYTKSLLAIKAGTCTDQDRMIVAMWELNRGMVAELQSVRTVNNQLSNELHEARRKISENDFMSVMSNAMAKDVPAVQGAVAH